MDNETKNSECFLACPNRKDKQLGKGYSLLFSVAIVGLLLWQSVTIKYSRDKGWDIANKEVPLALSIPCCFLVAGALGINTDPIAQKLGKFLTQSND